MTTESLVKAREAAAKKEKKKPSPDKPLPNIKHEVFANMLVKNKGNRRQSYIDAYGEQTKPHAHVNGSVLLNSHSTIQERVQYLLARNGKLSLENTLETLAKQMEATKPVVIKDEVELYPDNTAINNAVQTNLKLHGALKEKENTPNIQVSILSNPKEANELIDRILLLNKQFLQGDFPSGEVIDVA
jgi:hypothetical protein